MVYQNGGAEISRTMTLQQKETVEFESNHFHHKLISLVLRRIWIRMKQICDIFFRAPYKRTRFFRKEIAGHKLTQVYDTY